jgi:hypothetical protein
MALHMFHQTKHMPCVFVRLSMPGVAVGDPALVTLCSVFPSLCVPSVSTGNLATSPVPGTVAHAMCVIVYEHHIGHFWTLLRIVLKTFSLATRVQVVTNNNDTCKQCSATGTNAQSMCGDSSGLMHLQTVI